MNIKEEFENWVFEIVKETEKNFDYSQNEKDLNYVKQEIMFLRKRYPFIKKLEIEFKEFYKLYHIMKQEEQKQKNKKVCNLIPFPQKNNIIKNN